MKYNFTKKPTISASRTLFSLQNAMLEFLSKKSFEEITVQELCIFAMIPRATFYNYFEDKYDLLNYCFLNIHKKIDIGYKDEINCKKRLNIMMENFFDYFNKNIETVEKILKHNSKNKYLITQICFYITQNMIKAFENSSTFHEFKIPKDMAAKLYSESILIILERTYLDKKYCSKLQAQEYLNIMVSGVI